MATLRVRPSNYSMLRIYRSTPEEDAPMVVYIHGGGIVAGSVETYDTSAAGRRERLPV
ncbi:MAG: hypothetical protein ACUVV4_07205 [Candidatus Bathyarchaeia archaeon]